MATVDMFLKVISAKTGPIKGESPDKDHGNEIEVLAWSWGMKSPDMVGTASGKRSFKELQVRKRVDSATPPLYGALTSNDSLKVTLVVRKTGGGAKEYFKVLIDKGRVINITTQSADGEHPELLEETVSFAFKKVEIQYLPQTADGSLGGAISFNDQYDG